MSTLVYCLATFGAIHLIAGIAIVAFIVWFTYDSRQTSKKLDEMYDEDEDSN